MRGFCAECSMGHQDGKHRTPATGGRRRRRGGALVQTLVVVGIVGVALAVLVPVLFKVRAAAKSTHCLANLRTISTAFRMYAVDNRNKLPYPAFTEIPWERSLVTYTGGTGPFTCPGDEELAPATGSSYDWRDTGIPETTLAGENPMAARADAVLAFDALPGWHAKRQMNVVRADGSALPMEAGACVVDLQKPAGGP